jgi:3-hydroxyacyl-CoA dehydrogenase
MSEAVRFRQLGSIGIATIDHPPVNALSHAVRAGLIEALDRLDREGEIDALLIIGAGRGFIAGADITEFGRPLADPQLGTVIERIEGARKPVIAAIHGKALGGGLEVALACHYRLATATASIGLPEVKLGILPGAGGTQRLPRLIGLAAALAMIAEGGEMAAPAARDAGAIDELVEGDLEAAAVAFAIRVIAEKRGLRRVGSLAPPPEDAKLLEDTRKALAKKRRGFEAPQRAVDAVELAYRYPFEEALRQELALCKQLLASDQSAALRHNFAAEREVARVPGLPADTPSRTVRQVGIVGTGVMGSGIAMTLANAGIPVVALGRTPQSLERFLSGIRRTYGASIARKSLSQAEADARLARITATLEFDALREADLIIEAVAEDLAVKEALFARLGTLKPGVILASNTSYIDIDALAAASGRAPEVCGMHFFNPAPVMRLIENVRGRETAPEVLATLMALGKRLGKLAIATGNGQGFIVNRLLSQRSREAAFMLEEGATPERIDRALVEFGFPMGPYALSDLAGIDVQYAARRARQDRLTPRERAADFVDQLYALGRYGQKTNAGWYRYDAERKASPDPAIAELLAAHGRKRGIAPRMVEDREIRERCLYAMVNEGAKLMDEGLAPRPHEIDVAMINAVGFPAFTGGPMFWADRIGLEHVRDAMRRYGEAGSADYWAPSPLIERLAASGRGFYSVSSMTDGPSFG